MGAKKLKTVLFAEVSGRDEYVRAAGFVMGWNRISDCVERLQRTARSSGGKVVKVERVEWVYIPDQATAQAALAAGEVDYLEAPQVEPLPVPFPARRPPVADLVRLPGHLPPA